MSFLICLAPGPSILIVIQNTLKGGVSKGLLASLGVVLADAAWLLVTLSGLGAIIKDNFFLYNGLKVVGSLYLIYMGISAILAKKQAQAEMTSSQKAFWETVMITLLNAKIVVFILAFFPQYMDPAQRMKCQQTYPG